MHKNTLGTEVHKQSVCNVVLCYVVCQLADALQESNQARSELSLHQKLRADAQLRVEELEESILEKDQELMRLTQIVSRLQGEVRNNTTQNTTQLITFHMYPLTKHVEVI